MALAEGKGHLWGELLFIWEGAHDLPLGSLRGTASPCTFGARWGCGCVGILHGAGFWGCVLPGLALGGVWGAACCSQLCSVQSALLAELFLEDGDVSLQSRRSSGPRLPGRPSRRSLPGSQRSKKSISSQVQDGGAPSPALSQGTPQALLLALTTSPLCSAVQSLPEPADGDAGQHHAALRPLHQTQR